MPVIRYTAWDGSQHVDLSAPRVLAALADLLSSTDDVREAMEWLLRRGADLGGLRLQGLDSLLQRVREALREHHRQGTLAHVFDELRRQLDDALALERLATSREADGPAREHRMAHLAATPHRLSDALEHLRGHDFLDPDAAAVVEQLQRRLADVQRVEAFVREQGDRFRGDRPIGFEEALALLDQLEAWWALEEALAAGDLDRLDLAQLERLLGAAAVRTVTLLRDARQTLWDAGYLTTREGRVRLSPTGIRRIGQVALHEIYQRLLRDRPGAHHTDHRGAAERRFDEHRRWSYGDPLDVDVVATLKETLVREPGLPLRFTADDLRVHPYEHAATNATVLLLDMSWSMSWEGRYAAAKRVALALESLVRTRFPRDYFGIVGFYTRAVEVPVRDLPEASWNMGDPFTNLQDGLRLAARLLARQRTRNQHVVVVTDGQPTAYFAGGRLHCEWPLSFGGISERAARETLREVERVTRQGIVINTFMLDDSPSLRGFVEDMTRINKGRALYTRPDRLGEYLLVDHLARKRKRL